MANNNEINKDKIDIGDFLNLEDAKKIIQYLETEILVIKEFIPHK